MFAELCEELCASTTRTCEHEDKYEQHQDTKKPFTMQELNDAINQLDRGQATDTRGVNADAIKNLPGDSKKKKRTTTVQPRHQRHEQPSPNRRDVTIKVMCRAVARHHHRTTNTFVRSPSCTSSSASSTFSDHNARCTPASPLTNILQTTLRPTTFSRSSNFNRKSPSGTSRCGSQPSTLRKKRLRRSGTQQRMRGSKGARHRGTIHHLLGKLNDQQHHQCTLTLKASTYTSSEEPSTETRSARSCSTHSCNT